MELKVGYKQTEAGIIPEEWEVKRLGEIGKVVRGGSPRPAGDPKFFDGDFIPWLTVAALTNIPDHQLQVRHTESGLTEEGSKRSRTLQPETVIIANSGATLGIAKVSAIKCCANDGVAAIIDQHNGNKAFICHCINAQTQRLREVVATGNGQPNLNTGLIKEIGIPWPPQAEQAAIAECFSDLDKLLQSLEDAVAKKHGLKQAAMQELLTGKRRLPGFEGEWEATKLGDVANIKTGSRNNEDKNEDGEYPFFVRSDNVERINSYSYDCEAILVPGEGRIGEIFHYVNGRFDVHQRVYAITQFKAGLSGKFVHSYMAMNFGAWAMQNTVKATVDSLRLPTFKTFEMLVPPSEDEQDAIAAVLSEMDAELEAYEARLKKARDLKQGMMQELLSGRIRLR